MATRKGNRRQTYEYRIEKILGLGEVSKCSNEELHKKKEYTLWEGLWWRDPLIHTELVPQ